MRIVKDTVKTTVSLVKIEVPIEDFGCSKNRHNEAADYFLHNNIAVEIANQEAS